MLVLPSAQSSTVVPIIYIRCGKNSWIFLVKDNLSFYYSYMQAIVQEQVAHREWGPYAQRLLDPETRLWRNPQNGGHDDKAHPPIHPTKFSSGESNWSEDHKVCNFFFVSSVNLDNVF